MNNITCILDNESTDDINRFLSIYDKRPFDINKWGLQMESTYILYKILSQGSFAYVIESGTHFGYTDWFINVAFPDIKIITIDPENKIRKPLYYSEKNQYHDADITTLQLDVDFSKTLLFVDDHQDVGSRILYADSNKIKSVLFDDCYSIGFDHKHPATLMTYLTCGGDERVGSILATAAITKYSSFTKEPFTNQS
jgi:hypothetical protein